MGISTWVILAVNWLGLGQVCNSLVFRILYRSKNIIWTGKLVLTVIMIKTSFLVLLPMTSKGNIQFNSIRIVQAILTVVLKRSNCYLRLIRKLNCTCCRNIHFCILTLVFVKMIDKMLLIKWKIIDSINWNGELNIES